VTKSELVEQVASKANLGKKEASDAIDAFLDAIQDALASGTEVTFSGFGKFHVADRSARTGRNPQTGAPIEIKASRVPRFSAGSKLKQVVNR
jgi:DNA-binding protein HU-beta